MKPRITIQAIESLGGNGRFFGGDLWNRRFASAWSGGSVWLYDELGNGTHTTKGSYEEAQKTALEYVMGGVK